MSIVTNRSNIYIMSPITKYGDVSADWGPFMEKDFTWHGKPPNKDEAKKALEELRTLQGRIKSEHES